MNDKEADDEPTARSGGSDSQEIWAFHAAFNQSLFIESEIFSAMAEFPLAL